MKKTVVYTAITGRYDILEDPKIIDSEIDYICFTDNPNIKSDIWKIREFPRNDLDPVRKCRYVKIMPHKCLGDYKYSVWIDGNILIIDSIGEVVKKHLINNNEEFVTFKHPFRNCIYSEAIECIRLNKDSEKLINLQINHYKQNNFPKNMGLIESNVILRKHNSKQVSELMEDWWEYVSKYSRRDQLSFNYVAWKNGFKYSVLEGNSRGSSRYFRLKKHNKPLLTKTIESSKMLYFSILRKLRSKCDI